MINYPLDHTVPTATVIIRARPAWSYHFTHCRSWPESHHSIGSKSRRLEIGSRIRVCFNRQLPRQPSKAKFFIISKKSEKLKQSCWLRYIFVVVTSEIAGKDNLHEWYRTRQISHVFSSIKRNRMMAAGLSRRISSTGRAPGGVGLNLSGIAGGSEDFSHDESHDTPRSLAGLHGCCHGAVVRYLSLS